jgi:hypothetical protein
MLVVLLFYLFENCMHDFNFFFMEIRWGACRWKLPWGSQSAYTKMLGREFCSELMGAIVLITSFFECQVFFLVGLFYLVLFFECVEAMVVDIVGEVNQFFTLTCAISHCWILLLYFGPLISHVYSAHGIVYEGRYTNLSRIIVRQWTRPSGVLMSLSSA